MQFHRQDQRYIISMTQLFAIHLLLLCWLLVTVCLAGFSGPASNSLPQEQDRDKEIASKLLLGGGSFSLRSSMSVFRLESQPTGTAPIMRFQSRISLQESYSANQLRARLSFETSGTHLSGGSTGSWRVTRWGDFYVDSLRRTIVRHEPTRMECVFESSESMRRMLDIKFLEDLLPRGRGYVNFVGLARLLVVLSGHKRDMKLKTMPEDNDNGGDDDDASFNKHVRNLQTVDYTFEVVRLSNKPPIKFEVRYGAPSDPAAGLLIDHLDEIPLMITIEDQDVIRVIEFKQFEPLTGSGQRADLLPGQGKQLDRFTLPLLMGCAENLAKDTNGLVDPFEGIDLDRVQFSFRSSNSYVTPPSNLIHRMRRDMFVAYDASLAAMRQDILPIEHLEMDKTDLRIMNFRQNRLYHITERLAHLNHAVNSDKQLDQLDESNRQSRCVMAPIGPETGEESVEVKMSLGELLVGADKLVPMGRGSLRGVPCLVYEAHNASIPFWLDAPVVVETGRGPKWRTPMFGPRARPDRALGPSLVLYVTDGEQLPQLLQLEVYKLGSLRQSASFREFRWSLVGEAPDASQPESFFSLADRCPNKQLNRRDARLSLRLESVQKVPPLPEGNPLELSPSKSLLVLDVVQRDLKVPVSMVRDLEVKLQRSSDTLDLDPHNHLLASLLIRAHTTDLSQLEYVGQGRVDPTRAGVIRLVQAQLFQDCFMTAASGAVSGGKPVFGYNPLRMTCLVDVEQSSGSSQSNFIMDPDEPVEVYRVKLTFDQRDYQECHKLLGSNPSERNKLIGLQLDIPLINGTKVPFLINRLTLSQAELPDAPLTDMDQSDRLAGFGLPEGVAGNQRVKPSSLQEFSWSPLSHYLEESGSQMSEEQCQAACLADLSCQSYSVCLNRGEYHCVLSGTNFRSKNLLDQLKGNPREKRIKLKDGVDVIAELIRHPNCNLFNRNTLALFERPFIVRENFVDRRLVPVESLEQCAELCVRQNVETLAKELGHASRLFSLLSGRETELDGLSFGETLAGHQLSHKMALNEMCSAFVYLDLAEALEDEGQRAVDKLRDEMVQFDGWPKDREPAGFCSPGRQPSKVHLMGPHQVAGAFRSKRFKFRFEFLYQSQRGVSLKAAELKGQEREAYHEVSSSGSSHAKEQSLATVRTLICLGDNFQSEVVADESECARICFSQSWGPWPACRSFDIQIDPNSGPICYLNSVTMHQAVASQRLDLIEESSGQLEAFHFEPRAGYLSPNYQLDSVVASEQQDTEQKDGLKLSSLVAWFLGLMGVASGILIGWAGPVRLESAIKRQRSSLISREALGQRLRMLVEFRNQVNSEGLISTREELE